MWDSLRARCQCTFGMGLRTYSSCKRYKHVISSTWLNMQFTETMQAIQSTQGSTIINVSLTTEFLPLICGLKLLNTVCGFKDTPNPISLLKLHTNKSGMASDRDQKMKKCKCRTLSRNIHVHFWFILIFHCHKQANSFFCAKQCAHE